MQALRMVGWQRDPELVDIPAPVPTYWGTRPELIDVLRLAADGRLVARTEEFPLSRATDAYAAVRDGTVVGRAVVVADRGP